MQTIRNKIRSRRGASLTFALLLFLVCAVVGSVVLVAGTAASGRMSQIAEMDQRYYSVNSAVRLLIDTINGKEITVVETELPDKSKTYAFGNGTPFDPESRSNNSIAEDAVAFYITNTNTEERKKSDSVDTRLALDLTVSDDTSTKEQLMVNVKEEIQGLLRDNGGDFTGQKGTMILTVEQGAASQTQKNYAMELYFNADEKHFVELTKDINGNSIKTTTFKIAWQIQDIQIIGANRWKE